LISYYEARYLKLLANADYGAFARKEFADYGAFARKEFAYSDYSVSRL
jgi:hypothetical protein